MRKLKAYFLFEIAIALTIVGVLMIGVLKGRQMLEKAKLDQTVQQIKEIKMAVESFSSEYGVLPGEDESNNFGSDNFWSDLIKERMLLKTVKKPAIGGAFFVEKTDAKLSLKLSSNSEEIPILNKSQAQYIQKKINNESDAEIVMIKESGQKYLLLIDLS